MELEEVRLSLEWLMEMEREQVFPQEVIEVLRGTINHLADSDPSCYGAVEANLHHDVLVMTDQPIPQYLQDILAGGERGNGNF